MPGHVVKSTGPDPDPTEYLFISAEQRRIDQTKPYDPKKSVWAPDQAEGFVEAQLQGAKGEKMLTVKLPSGEIKDFKKELIGQVNPPKYEKCEDVSNLTFLNDPSVYYVLKSRYQAKLIYTYSGLFCIVVNPYKRYPIYTNRAVNIYMGKRRNEVPPHLFAICDGAYQNMMQGMHLIVDRQNQSMLITGESGAGKTENTKKVLSYFANVGASDKKETKQRHQPPDSHFSKKTPILEAGVTVTKR
ncbi:myosin heavy chain, muscle-like [Penaeus monodon]|uniref:myosin heavy chain, muscle-like n=1 Tax=Penaeus monodon TaxID=6687 RepID=UPI0018A70B67|nr:myosin heavy chain, muscle-like [Penaeus monodon]